jgi:hypothetical protein
MQALNVKVPPGCSKALARDLITRALWKSEPNKAHNDFAAIESDDSPQAAILRMHAGH